jgi:uncharacterized protein (TIGR03382 family)
MFAAEPYPQRRPVQARHWEKHMIKPRFAVVAAVLATSIVASASADVTITLTNQTFTGFNFSSIGPLSGTLTGASINVTLDASVAYTYADDLCLYVTPTSTLATGGVLQIGGFSNLNASQRLFWPNGASDAPGTTSVGTVTLVNALNFDANPAYSAWVGNGYGAANTSGTWTGTITLLGVNAVPAPGAMALLGLAGVVGRRRR